MSDYDESDDIPLGAPAGDVARGAQGEAFFVADTSAPADPEDFDWDDFLAGVRPTRRSVKIHPRGDLLATMDECEVQLDALALEHEEKSTTAARKKVIKTEFETLADRMDSLKAEFNASARWFTVEARSSEWVEKFRKGYAKDNGFTLPEDGEEIDSDKGIDMLLAQLAEQIVVPSGVTAKNLHRLYDVAESEVQKLLVAQGFTSRVAASAKVLTRDFSLPRSDKTPQAGSKRR